MTTLILHMPQGPLLPFPREFSQPQLLKNKVTDLLTSGTSSGWHSLDTDAGGGSLFYSQPLEEMARFAKTMGLVFDADLKAAK